MLRPRFVPALALLALLAGAATARATSLTPSLPLSLEGDESVATTDDARALLFNPAAVGLRYPDEFFEGFARYNAKHEWNSTLVTHGSFGFEALRQRDTSQTYGVAVGFGGEKLRFGWNPYWLVSGQPVRERVLDHQVGLLARPAPWAAMGFTVDRLFQPTFRTERRARHYTVGAGWRPLAMWANQAAGAGTRLTFSADVTIVDDGDWSQSRVRVAGEFEPAPGIALQATVADHDNFRFGVTLRGVNWSAHGGNATTHENPQYQTYSLSLHSGEERTVLVTDRARRVAVVRAGGVLADEALQTGLLGGYATASSRPVHRQLERALEDPLTLGVLLDLRGVAGMAQLEELRPLVAKLRAAGKPVVADLQYGGGRGDLYLAGACDRIVVAEAADFAPLGLRVEERYWKSALARAGVKLERSSVGPFKSAYRPFSADSMPAADSLSIGHELDVRQAIFTETLCADRHLAPERLATFLDGRVWPPADLARAGVIDSVGYREDALRMLGEMTGLGAKPRTVDLGRARVARRPWTLPQRVAVVYAGGGISPGRSANDLLYGSTLGDETLVAQLERAFHAPGVRAVVLRIESPGGDVVASSLVDHAIVRLKRETGRPFVVSMGSLAGSAGYLIACRGDRVFADRHTRTASIGVVYTQPSFAGLYRKLGARQVSIERGDRMGGSSWSRDWGPREQATADSAIGRHYDRFLAAVAAGRRLDPAKVLESAGGRVWLGDDARERGLVDAIGGLDDAIREARRRGGVPEGERIGLLELGRPRPALLERLVGDWVRGALASAARLEDDAGAQLRMPDADAGPILE